MPNSRLSIRFLLSACAAIACVTASLAHADEPLKVVPLLGEQPGFDFGPATGEPEVSFSLTPNDAQPGDEVTLSVKLMVPFGSYTYSNNPAILGGTKIVVDKTVGLEPVDKTFTPDHKPKGEYSDVLERQIEKHQSDVVWSRKYRIAANANLQQVSVAGSFDGQVCNDSVCLPIRETFTVSLGSESEEPEAGVEIRPYREVVTPARKPGKPEPIELTFELTPEDAKSGDEVTLSITAEPLEGYHIFALSQNPKMAGVPTTLKIESHPGLKPIDAAFQPSKQPEVEKPLENIIQRVHYGKVIWTRRFRVEEGISAGEYGIDGSMLYQICRKGACRRPTTIPILLGAVVPAEAKPQSPTNPSPAPAELAQNGNEIAATNQIGSEGLVPFLITAFLAGFAALLTPCVFPMIPITVSFFLKQSEKEHHRPVTMASAYCFGIVATFTGLGLLMAALFQATSLNQLANNPWLNLGIAGMLVFFGMNLLGMFEIRIPSWLLTWSSGGQSRGGIAGVLFMALTFTLVSFTCTFAFAGGLLVLAAKGEYFWPILGMLAFSSAFSLPFFFLALFPSLLQKLPKSGGWMNTVKVTMGLIECGAAFKFLSVADLSWNPVPMIFDFSMVMSAWIVISICTGSYLLGFFRLPHDTPSESISVVRLAFAMTFFGLASYLAVGLFGTEKPSGKVWEQIAAFATPRFEGGKGDIGPYLEHDGMQYALDVDKAKQYAKDNNQPLFLDFTGVNCVNCRLMEGLMAQSHNRKQLEKFVRVQLYTDNIPLMQDRKRAEVLLDENRRLQEDWFGDVTLPAYAVVSPDGKTLLAKFKGVERTEGDFAKFLAAGHAKWQRLASGRSNVKAANAAPRIGATSVK